MFQNYKKYWLLLLVFFLLVFDIFIFYLNWLDYNRVLTFAMLDVGQGDSLFVESPSGAQVLIDGGPSRKILNQLSRVMPPFDQYIDALIITNPDQDHIGGFLDVLKFYKVGKIFESGALTDSKIYQNFREEARENNIPIFLARRGMKLDMGKGVEINFLFPDRNVSAWATNDGSIVSKLSYKNFSAILMGDATLKTEKIILKEDSSEQLHSNFLKIGHHGSRSSSSIEFLKAIDPKYALISVGENNRYGHPHLEVLNMLNSLGFKVLRTDLLGAIIMKSDGQNVTFSFTK